MAEEGSINKPVLCPKFESPLDSHKLLCLVTIYKCAALCRAVFGPSATERPPWNYL